MAAVLGQVQPQRQAIAQHRLELHADLAQHRPVGSAQRRVHGDFETARLHHVRRLRHKATGMTMPASPAHADVAGIKPRQKAAMSGMTMRGFILDYTINKYSSTE